MGNGYSVRWVSPQIRAEEVEPEVLLESVSQFDVDAPEQVDCEASCKRKIRREGNHERIGLKRYKLESEFCWSKVRPRLSSGVLPFRRRRF
jgi:hypothetical protein